jgi:hypothetical protein
MFGFRLLRVLAPLAVVCGALFAVSCGSSNSSPSSSPTSYPTNAAEVATLSTSAGQIVLPQVSPGAYVTLNYIGSSATPFPSPFPAAGVTLNTTIYAAPPTNAPAPTSFRRSKLSQANAVGVQYVTFTLSNAMPTNFISSEVLTLTSTMPVNQPYYIELDDLSNTSNPYINTFPGTAVNNGTVTFTNSNGFNTLYNGFATASTSGTTGTQSLNTTDTYLMQIYYLSTGVPATPTPSPTPVATASGTISPVATPTPVVVATTVPLGSAVTLQLPVVAGGYIANNIGIPAAGSSSSSLTVSGSSSLPTGITTIGNSNSFYPFYVLGLASTGSASFKSPGFSVVLPSNFSTSTYPIQGALCTVSACPIDTTSDENVASTLTTTNGVSTVSFAPGAFPGFTGVSTTQQYIIVYSSRSTPAQNDATPLPLAAGATGTVQLPTLSNYGGSLNIGGLGGATTVNVSSEPGLLPNISAIIPNTQTIFYSLSINATPHVSTTAGGPLCGSSGCTLASLTIPAAIVSAAGSAAFYVEECSSTACPVSSGDVLKLTTPTASPYTLTVPGTFGTDITSLDPTATTFLVFYYQ